MKTNQSKILVHKNAPKIVLALSILIFTFYLTGLVLLTDIYQYAVVGMLYELLSIPMLFLLVIVPVLGFIQLTRYKNEGTWYAVASLILIAATIVLLVKSS